MRRVLPLAGLTFVLGFIGLSVTDPLQAAPPVINQNVAIVDATNPAAPRQVAVTASGELTVNCTTGCSAGSGTGANDADNVASVSTGLGSVVGYGYVYDGSAWDRLRGDSTNGAFVNVKVLPALVAGSAIIGNVRIDQTTPGTTNGVQVNAALPAGANSIGAVTPAAATTGGATIGKTLSTASTNATSVKGSAGTLYSLTAINTTATIYYLKLYNTSSAPACNSDTVVASYPVPASTSGAGLTVQLGPVGIAFGTGIGLCLTAALADNDNTNAATGVAITYGYK